MLRSLGLLKPASTQLCTRMCTRTQTTLARRASSKPHTSTQQLHPQFNAELELKRIVPQHATFYSPNADHENNLNELKALDRKYTNLPRVNNVQGKWLSMQQYEPMAGDERLKSSQHKQLLKLLNRLNTIDPQLRPTEVQNLLTKYSRSTSMNDSAVAIKSLDEFGRSRTVGGRKSSSATVYLVKGTGEFLVNGKPLNQHFAELKDRQDILYPFKVVEAESEYNVFALVNGGGPTGQAGAIVNAIGKGLIIHNPLLKNRLYKAGCMTRDHRRVERKKPGKVKARKSPTWVKR